MSAALTNVDRPIRSLRCCAPLLAVIAERWPSLFDAAIDVIATPIAPRRLAEWTAMDRIDRTACARWLALLALAGAVDRGERALAPETRKVLGERLSVPPGRALSVAVAVYLERGRAAAPAAIDRLFDAELATHGCAS